MSELNLRRFERSLIIRPLRACDWDFVVALQEKCFPKMGPWTKEQFASQLALFPEGQICAEYQGKLVASSSSLLLDFELYKDWHSWDEISDNGFIRNHKPTAKTLYGIELMLVKADTPSEAVRKLSEFTPRYLS